MEGAAHDQEHHNHGFGRNLNRRGPPMSAALQVQSSPTIVCSMCAVRFWFDAELHARRKDDGRDFYCPNGHRLSFTETRAKKLERELEEERAKHERQLESERKRREWAEQDALNAKRSASAYKGQVTKVRRRVGRGVCPCCNRTFGNLASHMQTKHPEWADSDPHESDQGT